MLPTISTAQSVKIPGSGAEFGKPPEHIRPPPSAFGRKYVLQLLIVFAAYFLAGKLGLAVPFTNGNVSPIWPPAGIALAAMLLAGYRIWPAVAAGAFVVNFLTPISPGAAVALAAGNTAGPLVGAWLLRRLPGFRPSLSRLEHVLGLILLAAPTGAAISATVGVTVLFTTHVDPWLRFWPAWLVWWLGDVTGMLIVAPLVLTVLSQKRSTGARHIPELAALFGVALLVCLTIFDGPVGAGIENDVLAFAVLPVVLWGAIRFEIPGAAGVTLLISCMAVWETGGGFGPFVRNGTLQNATMLQAFIAVISVSGLTLASVIAERALLIRLQAQREGIEQGERRYLDARRAVGDGVRQRAHGRHSGLHGRRDDRTAVMQLRG
jgi:integral membrane sensor domain MASE1